MCHLRDGRHVFLRLVHLDHGPQRQLLFLVNDESFGHELYPTRRHALETLVSFDVSSLDVEIHRIKLEFEETLNNCNREYLDLGGAQAAQLFERIEQVQQPFGLRAFATHFAQNSVSLTLCFAIL